MYNEDIFELAGDLNTPNITPEWHEANDFYGNAHILKQYAELPTNYPLKAVIEHGPTFPKCQWNHDLKAPFPVILTYNMGSAQYIFQTTQKLPVIIGPLIAYVQPYLSNEDFLSLKKKLGKNLLVFLYHSSHHTLNTLDNEKIIKEIKKEEKNYDSVTINIYWRDITKELVDFYSSYGYYCVTCGHMYNNNFLNRQKTIIELSDAVINFGLMTSSYFSFFLNKKIKIIDKNVLKILMDDIDKKTLIKEKEMIGIKLEKYSATMKKLLGKFTNPTDQIKDFMSFVCDFDQKKTQEEMRNIFTIAEEMYTLPQLFSLKRYAHPLEMIEVYKKMGQEKKRQIIYKYLQKINAL